MYTYIHVSTYVHMYVLRVYVCVHALHTVFGHVRPAKKCEQYFVVPRDAL